MKREEARTVAQIVYKDIRKALDELEKDPNYAEFLGTWDGCVMVDENLFTESELIGEEK